MAKQFTLGKNERLKSRKQIEQLFKEGKSFSVHPYRVYYLFLENRPSTPNPTSEIQFGVGVSGKNFRKAVDRNRIKRLTREAYRMLKSELMQRAKEEKIQLNLFFIYTAKQLPDFNTAAEKVTVILKKLLQLINGKNSSNT